MDSITHIALGACMGQAFAGKQLGKRAMLWGAMALIKIAHPMHREWLDNEMFNRFG
jgi:hypothetical protein